MSEANFSISSGGHKSKTLLVVALLPFILYVILVMSSGLSFHIPLAIFTAISLFLSGVGVTASHKTWKLVGFISVGLFTIIYGIMGYFDYFKWTSTKVAIGLLIFYLIIYVLTKYLKHA